MLVMAFFALLVVTGAVSSKTFFGEKNAFWGSKKPGYDHPQFNPHDQNWRRLLLNRKIKLWRKFNCEKQNGCGR